MDSSKFKVILTGVPKHCGLKQIKAEIVDSLEASRDCITSVKRCKTTNGEIIPGKLEVSFASQEEVDKLLKQAVLEVEHNDELSVMRITRCRPSATSVSSESQLRSTPTSTPPPIFKEENASFSSAATSNIYPQLSTENTTKTQTKSSFAWGSDSSDDEFEKVSSQLSTFRTPPPRNVLQQSSEDFMHKSRQFEQTQVFRASPSKDLLQKVQIPKQKTSFFDILQTDPEIFDKYRNNGVLVHIDTDDDLEIKKVSKFIGSLSDDSRPIKTALLNDGVLLVYETRKAAVDIIAKSFLDNDEQIGIVSKPLPPVYADRILIKGNFAKNATDEVKEIIGTCSHISFKVKKLRECDMFLVLFNSGIDVNEVKQKVKKLKLKLMKPEVVKVCRTDCIKVQNVKESARDVSVRLAFMNKSLTKGDVTAVRRSDTNKKIAYVYYANYQDAEALVQNSKQQEVKVQQLPVEVSLYWTAIKGSVEFSANHIFQFFCPLDSIDRDLVTFVDKSRQCTAEFHKDLGDLAQIEIISDPETAEYNIKIKPLLTPEQSQDMEQEKFESQCQARIFRFFRKFQTQSSRFTIEDKERVREANKWIEDESFVVQEIKKDETVRVFVKWEDINDRETIKVVGLPVHVRSFLNWFDVQCKHTEAFEEFDSLSFDIIINCGIVEDLESVFEGTTELKVNKNTKSVLISGPRDTVQAALSGLKNNLKRTLEHDVTFLNKAQLEFLSRSLQDKTRSREIIEFIQDKLKGSDIRVSLQQQGSSLKLIYSQQKRHELPRAEEELRALLKFQIIPIESGYDEIMREEDWLSLKAKVESSGKLYVLPDRQGSSITLVGLPLKFSSEFERISAYMAENVETDLTVEMNFSHAMFFSSFSKEIEVEKHIHDSVEWYKEDGGIHLKGRACLVKKVRKWINDMVSKFVTQSKELCIPGIAEYLRSQSGNQFLQTTSKDNACFIKLDSLESLEWAEARKKAHQSRVTESQYEIVPEVVGGIEEEHPEGRGILNKIGETLSSIGKWVQGSDDPTSQQMKNVKIKVVKGDILASQCEVMINTTGSEFNLTLSRVSQALIRRAGQAMIDECANNPVEENKIMRVTKAPNLTFKYVIHLVSPRSPAKITQHLFQALVVAEKKLRCKSIAVPAIGTGKIEMSDANVAQYIRKAIDEFRKTNPKHLTQVDVVVFEQRMLASFQNALTDTGSPNPKVPKSASAPPATAPSTSQRKGNVAVNVTSGDILASNCQVVLNTTGSDFNLTASLVSAKLIMKGGNSIVGECQSNPMYNTNECRVTSGGATQFKYIVHFITPQQVNVLAQMLESVLQLINDKLRSKSVAIPAIGTGKAGLPVDQVVQAVNQAINNFVARNPTYLQRIDVVIFDPNLLNKFQSNITRSRATASSSQSTAGSGSPHMNTASSSVDEEASMMKPQKSNRSRLRALESTDDRRHRIMLYFTSTSKQNNKAALDAVIEKANKKCSNARVHDPVLEMLDDDDLLDIKDIEREFNVCIKLPDDDSENQFDICGLRIQVMEAQKHTQTRLHKYNQAVTCSDYITWEYEDPPNSKAWKPFALFNNFELESQFKEDPDSKSNFKIKMKGTKKDVFVDFKKSTMVDGSTTYSIRQTTSGPGHDRYPAAWDKTQFRQLVRIQPHTQEYKDVIKKFTDGNLPLTNVIQLDRVENKRQYIQFVAQRKDVEMRMKAAKGVNLPVTRELFHGTTSSICDQIYKGGFDRSYAGKNATVYGVGVYFAVKSDYSHRYTDNSNQRKMFLADVITGQFAQGNQNMRVPPPIPGSTDNHDSVVDNISNPTIFVVFKDASVYPLYILTYN